MEGAVSVAASGSKNLDGKANQWQAGAVSTPSSNEAGGDYNLCEVEERQAARVKVQGPKNEDFNQKEVEGIGFVPSALSEPRGAIHWCGNRCCEESFRFHQIAVMVTEEGGEAHTISLCKFCYNESAVRQGKQPLKLAEWKEIVERKAHRGRLWKIFGVEQFVRGMWEYFTFERAWAKKGIGGCRKREARRNTRSAAARVLLQRSSGASRRVFGCGLQCLHDAPRVSRGEIL